MANLAAISDGAGVFHAANTGAFVTTPYLLQTPAHAVYYAGETAPPGGRFGTEKISTTAAPQSGTQDLTFRNIRRLFNTGEVHLSALTGVLSKLTPATYTWLNPQFTYGAAGTALTIAGVAIPATGVGRAVVIYDITGAII